MPMTDHDLDCPCGPCTDIRTVLPGLCERDATYLAHLLTDIAGRLGNYADNQEFRKAYGDGDDTEALRQIDLAITALRAAGEAFLRIRPGFSQTAPWETGRALKRRTS